MMNTRQESPAHPAWHNWLARETFTIYRDLKVESSSLSVGAGFFRFFSATLDFRWTFCDSFVYATGVKCTVWG
jgi:hypothetical protein